MHGKRESLEAGEGRDGLVQRSTDGVGRVRRDAYFKLRSRQTAKWQDRGLQLLHAGRALFRIRAEDFLIDDPAPAEIVQRAHHRSRAARLRDARNAARPAVSYTCDRRFVERFRSGCVLELSNPPDPCDELGLVVLGTATEMRQLEVRVTIHQPGDEGV